MLHTTIFLIFSFILISASKNKQLEKIVDPRTPAEKAFQDAQAKRVCF